MKKLFFAICFNLLWCGLSFAAVRSVSGYEAVPRVQSRQEKPKMHDMEYEEFKEIVEEGFSKAEAASPENINQTMGIVPSRWRAEQEKEAGKSFFEKIYEEALERVNISSETPREDVASVETLQAPQSVSQQKENWQNPDVPLIRAYLPPDNTPFTIPAMEHIPYLMNSIEVLPTGLVKFEETIVVVANGNKLRRGLTKILPEKIYDINGKSQRLDYSIIGVTINDMPAPYHLTKGQKSVLLVPDDNYELAPGIYTYKFEYVVDNLLWDEGKDYRLYWDIGGNGWNLVIDRLGASLSLPTETALLDEEVLLGSPLGLSSRGISVRQNGRFARAYIARRPLFIGEGMHLVAQIDKNALLPETLWQKVIRAFDNHGDIYIALLGMLVISCSFVISWRYIAKDKGQLKLTLNKTAMTIRYLMFDRFDIKSVCGFLLELYKKNIIDIQQSGETVLLIKRTDNLKSLQSFEQKALKKIFSGHETVFNVNAQNKLPLKRFAAILERGLNRLMFQFRIKLNMGYLLFSLGMLLAAEGAIAFFAVDSLYTFGILTAVSLAGLGAMALSRIQMPKWLKVFVGLAVIDVEIFCFIVLSAVVHPITALILVLIPVIIIMALDVYSRRRGLIRHYIRETADLKEYLKKHHDTIVLGKSFLTYQAAIWALDMEKDFIPIGNPEYNKLPTVSDIAALFRK